MHFKSQDSKWMEANTRLSLLLMAILASACNPNISVSQSTESAQKATASYTLSVTVSGLGTGKKVVIHESATPDSDLTFESNTTLAFASPRTDGDSYDVSILEQPTDQSCKVAANSGKFSSDVTINVVCSTETSKSVTNTVTPTPEEASDIQVLFSYEGASGTSGVIGSAFSVAPTTLSASTGTITNCNFKSGTESLPSWANVDSSTCTISGVPDAIMTNTTFTLLAQSSTNASAEATVTLQIGANVPVLSFSTATGTTSTFGANLSITPTILESRGASVVNCLVKSGTTSLPAWASLDPTTCQISGTPDAVQSSTQYTIQAYNSVGASEDATVSIQVSAVAPILSFTNATGISGNVGQTMSISPTSLLEQGANITGCALASGSLPSGLTINANTCVISGTPSTTSNATVYSIIAINSAGSSSAASVTITVNATAGVLDFGALGTPPATGLFALGGDLTASQTSSDATSMTLTLSAGRSYGFSLIQNRNVISLTSCDSDEDHEFVSVKDDMLVLDIPGASSNKSDTITCSSSGGSLTINLTILKAPLWHVSSSATLLRSAPAKIYLGGFSKDGRIVAYSARGLGSEGYYQVFVKNLDNGKLQIASSSDGTSLGNGDSGISLPGNQTAGLQYGNLSEDGRYVVFFSSATNLVTGVTGTHVYRKDLEHPEVPPLVVDSLDSTQADQTNYVGNGISNNASMSPDARFIVYESTSTSFYAGTGGARHGYLKDMNNQNVAPKIVDSLDHTKADQSQTFTVNSVNTPYTGGGGNYRNSTVSPDGRYVYFRNNGLSKFLVGNGSGYQVMRRDMTKTVSTEADFLDDTKHPLMLISSLNPAGVDQTGRATTSTATAVASDDGRFIAYPGVNVTSSPPAVQALFLDFQTILNGDYATAVTPKVISSSDPSRLDQTGYYADGGLPQNIMISRDGRYTVFYSAATNLTTPALSAQNRLWLWDRTTPDAAPKVLTSLDSNQSDQTNYAGNATYNLYFLAKDAGKIVFESGSDNFITDSGEWSSGQELYTKSLAALQEAPERIDPIHDKRFLQHESVGANVLHTKISGNGRYMIWSEVGAINFFKGLDSASAHVFWKDLQNPLAAIKIVSSGDPEAVDQTLHAFNGANGTNGIDISDDGSIVLFTSSATNAYTGANGRQIIACRMLTVGYPCQVVNSTNTSAADQTGLISTGSTVEQPKISGDGSFAIWIESSVSYGYSNYSTKQVFGKSLATGDENVGPRILSSLAPTTLNQTGQVANAAASAAIVNSDGSKFVFTTAATNLCTNCGPAARVQVYLGTVGSSPTFQMLSSKTPSAADQVNDRGNAAAGTGLAWSGSNRYVAFTSLASNLNATYTMPAFLQVYRVDLNDLSASPILISTSDATESNQSGFASGVAVANALAISNDGNRIYFGSAFAGYLASTASNTYRRIWERNVSNASLTLVTYRGGSVSDVANIFKATHCDVNAASKEAVPKISMICSGADQMPGLTSKANAFIKDMSN